MNPVDRLIADLLRGRPRWPEVAEPQPFLARARLHGVGALLHAACERAPVAPPAEVREALREHALRAAVLELDTRRELPRLLAAMAGAGVRPILIKGTPLAYTLYPEPGLRERADVDLLVAPADRDRLFEVLAAQGYRRTDAAGGDFAVGEASFTTEGTPLVVDVHWRIGSSPLLRDVLEYESLAARAAPVPALGPHAHAPGAVDATLLAAIHRAKHHQSPFHAGDVAHRGDRLIWLYDLHLLAPALSADDRAALAEHAASRRVAGLCLDALLATRDAFGTAIPAGLLDALGRAAKQPEPSMAFLRGGRRGLLLAEVRVLPTWRERWRLLREHALPPADYMLGKYRTTRRWLLPALYARRALGWLMR